jgi:hypothetical protein
VLGVCCRIYKSSYNISSISYLNLPLPSFSFIHPSPIPGIVSTGIIFPFRYMCTQYLHLIHYLTPFPHLLPTPMFQHSPPQTVTIPPFYSLSLFKKWHSCLFKIAIQGVSLWHFHVYIYIITQIGLSLFFPFVP